MITAPDPRLKEAMTKILGILQEYDIAGTVALASREAGEHLLHVCPSWSCMRVEPSADGDVIRIKALRKDFESQEAQVAVISDTLSTLNVLSHMNADFQENCDAITKCIGQKIQGITTIRKVG